MRKVEVKLYKFKELSKDSQIRAIREFDRYHSREDDLNDFEFNAIGDVFYAPEWE